MRDSVVVHFVDSPFPMVRIVGLDVCLLCWRLRAPSGTARSTTGPQMAQVAPAWAAAGRRIKSITVGR